MNCIDFKSIYINHVTVSLFLFSFLHFLRSESIYLINVQIPDNDKFPQTGFFSLY